MEADMKLSESIKPISHVKTHMSEIIENLSHTHTKVVITHNGEAKAVLQDIQSFEELQDSLAMLKIIAMSTKSMLEGKGQSVKEAFREVRDKVKELHKNDL
jgi:prevent-host-death family protein